MKIRSLLLGSVAAAGLSTAGFAADLGVITSLDLCDDLGLSSKLAIASADNCLVIDGGVSFEYKIGNYAPGVAYATFSRNGANYNVDAPGGGWDTNKGDVDAWLRFVATSPTDVGNATATIKLISENSNGTSDWTVGVDEAWVGIGDTTMLMAGYKGSIFSNGNDEPLNYLGLFNSSNVDTGVGFQSSNTRGGNVIQVTHSLGDGLMIGGAVEGLGALVAPAQNVTAVGVLKYDGDGLNAHLSSSIDTAGIWNIHAGFKGSWDPITVVAAVAADNGWWNTLGSVSATFDMFTLAASGEATSAGEWGVGGSLVAAVTDDVKLNLGSRYFDDTADTVWQAEAGVEAKVTDTIKATAAIGAIDGTAGPMVFYAKGGLAWEPGGQFKSSIEGKAQSNGAFSATFKASKDIK